MGFLPPPPSSVEMLEWPPTFFCQRSIPPSRWWKWAEGGRLSSSSNIKLQKTGVQRNENRLQRLRDDYSHKEEG